MLKKATIILVSAAITAVALFALGHAERVTRHVVLSILRSVPCLFLTTTRVEQLCVSHVDDSSWLWGTRQGMSHLNVRTYLGVDLAKLVPASIHVDDQHVVVYLPEPEVLDVVPDLASWKYVSKASGASSTCGMPCAGAAYAMSSWPWYRRRYPATGTAPCKPIARPSPIA